MKKKVLAGILMMILVLASVITVSANPSTSGDPHVKDSDESGYYKVELQNPFDGVEATVKKNIEEYNAGKVTLDKVLESAKSEVKAAVKGKTNIGGIFDLIDVNGGQPVGGVHEVTITVPGISKAKDVVVLHYSKVTNEWEVVKSSVSGDKVTAIFADLSPVAVFGVVEAGGSTGESPKTVGTSSAWMLWTAMALVVVGAGAVVSQKKSR